MILLLDTNRIFEFLQQHFSHPGIEMNVPSISIMIREEIGQARACLSERRVSCGIVLKLAFIRWTAIPQTSVLNGGSAECPCLNFEVVIRVHYILKFDRGDGTDNLSVVVP
jgi:hypothetical protein